MVFLWYYQIKQHTSQEILPSGRAWKILELLREGCHRKTHAPASALPNTAGKFQKNPILISTRLDSIAKSSENYREMMGSCKNSLSFQAILGNVRHRSECSKAINDDCVSKLAENLVGSATIQ